MIESQNWHRIVFLFLLLSISLGKSVSSVILPLLLLICCSRLDSGQSWLAVTTELHLFAGNSESIGTFLFYLIIFLLPKIFGIVLKVQWQNCSSSILFIYNFHSCYKSKCQNLFKCHLGGLSFTHIQTIFPHKARTAVIKC